MSSISSIAMSGMMVARERLATSAGNVANVNTDGYQAKRTQATEGQNGAVSSATVPTEAPSYARIQDDAAVIASNTDLISERTEQLGASHAFKANLNVIKTNDEMTRSLLDIKA